MHQPKTPEEQRNAAVIRELYAAAEGAAKDTPKFVSLFEEGGYFYDVAAGKKYYGQDIGYTVDVYATAFPDMHRELYNMYFNDDVVAVELSLNGTHKGDLAIPAGVIAPTNKEMHAPCCDVFHLKNGKVLSFHCYVAVPILLEQLGVFKNLSAAIRRSGDSGRSMNALAPVMFRFPAGLVPGAQRVAVVGPFNGWNRTVHTMSRPTGGDWTLTIYLPPGRVVYLFDVDGEFWLDPDDEERDPNSWGSEYSIRYVGLTPAGAKNAEGPDTAGSRGHDQGRTRLYRPTGQLTETYGQREAVARQTMNHEPRRSRK